MYGVCGCCGALRPRYKRLVDNIFPEDPEDGLVKANMEKLTFYALSAPEKLDRIGAYLSERLSRDVARHRYGYVCIAMEALDQLLMACHCQSINLFVESFLKMVRKLLEADKPNLQILGTNSFVKFANIEEDTPSYHRSYDFFVFRFSEMCHSTHDDPEIRTKIRMAGIRGLQGVVRKTVNDELQANIWDPRHMDKIVPSLLFNLQQEGGRESQSPPPLPPSQVSERDADSAAELTERCFRELLGRAAYGNIKNAITPVLMHLDSHSLWEGKTFACHCFKIIMYSIQSQHSHLVIQQLLGHLDANSKNSATVRAGIVEVLSEAAAIEASGSIGPTVLEVFNTLLKQLRFSVDYELTGYYDSCGDGGLKVKVHEERQLQEAVIKMIGSFANTLPTYQCSEVMMFIMGKIPIPGMYPAFGSASSGVENCRMIQVMLLKSLLQVTRGFRATNMLTALPSSFLDPLLSSALMEDAEVRLLVLEILVSLIDRHDNRPKFCIISIIPDISLLKLKVDKCSRQDNLFMNKHSQHLYRHIFMSCKEESSTRPHFEALYALLALISMELANEEVLVDLIRLTLALQDLVLANEDGLPVYNRCAIHALCAAYLNVISQLTTVPTFCQHVHEVIENRQKDVPFLLPEDVFTENPQIPKTLDNVEGGVLFLQSKITDVLRGSGYNTERLATPYIPQFTDEDRLSKRKSIGDTVSLQMEVDSSNSPEKKCTPAEEITFEILKKAIVNNAGTEEQERERRKQVVEKFQKAPFEEIAAHCGARASLLQSKLNQIFELTIRPPPSPSGTLTAGQQQERSVPVYEMKFPNLCVY
ncbi:protein EFR3 homolog B-like isoform X1 [Brienomyrus brachyistius]|uniref:protein EFR3 homolog B-like isoform X1 n=2 Tax=Brienomyrus brachyistius TaxID=42636 RepID=UPI0020B450BB|nr:protein EFR3 homolog B-like isoform X1 [Brienomyrus brachyistius]XP_048831510.1 protein EFR3 homolog B-like isoform X1 [Brienomyrus brachyistius]